MIRRSGKVDLPELRFDVRDGFLIVVPRKPAAPPITPPVAAPVEVLLRFIASGEELRP